MSVTKTDTSRIIWMTGLSGAGKTTLARGLKNRLEREHIPAIILDGDELRTGLNQNLSFTAEDRLENVRRTAEVAKLFAQEGYCVIVSLITPGECMREKAREITRGASSFILTYVNAPLAVCRKRDVKGLYQKVNDGAIQQFTGISSPFEEPVSCDLEIRTDRLTTGEAVEKLYSFCYGKKNDTGANRYPSGIRKLKNGIHPPETGIRSGWFGQGPDTGHI